MASASGEMKKKRQLNRLRAWAREWTVMPELDILYMTRVQKERFDETEYKHMAAKFVLELATLEGAKPTMKILHPLPRVDEIEVAVDKTPHAYYFQQAENGVYARQALLALVLNETV